MSSLPPDPSFPDSRRLRLEAEAAQVEETVAEHPQSEAKPAPKAAAKLSPKKKPV